MRVMDQEEEDKAWACSQRRWLKKDEQRLGRRKLMKNTVHQYTSTHRACAGLESACVQLEGKLCPARYSVPQLQSLMPSVVLLSLPEFLGQLQLRDCMRATASSS